MDILELLKKIFGHKRMKSLYWRVSGMLIAGLAITVPEQLTEFNAPGWLTIFLGLVLGEVTKSLNSKNA